MLDFLAEQPEVADTKVGTTGYCMGGGLALNAAGRFPDRVGAAASFHGGQIATDAPDSPHLLAGAMTAQVYVAGAANDGSFDDEQFERLSTALTEAGVDHTLVTYPALHGFAVPDNPTYDEAAAARHWQALAELYASALLPGSPAGAHDTERAGRAQRPQELDTPGRCLGFVAAEQLQRLLVRLAPLAPLRGRGAQVPPQAAGPRLGRRATPGRPRRPTAGSG